MAEHLERAGLLAQADDGKLFPGREISSITLAEIIHSARTRVHRTRSAIHVCRRLGCCSCRQDIGTRLARSACGTSHARRPDLRKNRRRQGRQ